MQLGRLSMEAEQQGAFISTAGPLRCAGLARRLHVVGHEFAHRPVDSFPSLPISSHGRVRAAVIEASMLQHGEGGGSAAKRGSRRKAISQALLSAATFFAVARGPVPFATGGAAVAATIYATPASSAATGAAASASASAAAEGQSGFISGIAVSLVKQTVLYPVDTIKVRLQTMPLAPGQSVWYE